MGEVYKAYHPQLQRPVAIKVLLTNRETGPEFIARFQHEAMAVARLRHPHIVQVFDFDIEDDTPYMVMEFVEGETLSQRMTRYHRAGRLMPIEEVVRLFQQLCAAVDYAHRRGMLHRDIKPANVIINGQGDAILTDFGLAKISGVSGFTASGSILGTPHYMSPEQGQGQAMDPRSDVYSLSVILYEMLAGKRPFQADTPVAVILQHIMAPPPPIEEANPTVSSALAQVVLLGMAKQPEERFVSAAAMGTAVATAVNQTPLHFNATGPISTQETLATVFSPAQPAGRAGGNAGQPPAGFVTSPTAREPQTASERLAHGSKVVRRKPTNTLSRFAIIGILLLLIIVGSGILVIGLVNTLTPQTTTTSTADTVGSVAFLDSTSTDFTHIADVLSATFTHLKKAVAGSTYFAWLCDSGNPSCTLLGALRVQDDGSATLTFSNGTNLLSVSNALDPTNLSSTLTFKITQEQTEASAPPQAPSPNVVYSGLLKSQVLTHIRHQLVAFSAANKGNTTALDIGLGTDAILLTHLANQLKTGGLLKDQTVAAEEILNLIVGQTGQRDWNQDGSISLSTGDDGFGLGTDASVDSDECYGPQTTTYLQLTMQHACLTAITSGQADLLNLFNQIKAAGATIAQTIASIESIAQKIARATSAGAFSQDEVNTLVEAAVAVLNGRIVEAEQQDGAQQLLRLSEGMATITINSV
jgi:serine/threonine-protein kinase